MTAARAKMPTLVETLTVTIVAFDTPAGHGAEPDEPLGRVCQTSAAAPMRSTARASRSCARRAVRRSNAAGRAGDRGPP